MDVHAIALRKEPERTAGDSVWLGPVPGDTLAELERVAEVMRASGRWPAEALRDDALLAVLRLGMDVAERASRGEVAP